MYRLEANVSSGTAWHSPGGAKIYTKIVFKNIHTQIGLSYWHFMEEDTKKYTSHILTRIYKVVLTFIRGLHQKKLVLSSLHDGKTPCQESGRMRGSVGSCPHHGSWPVVLSFGCVWPL